MESLRLKTKRVEVMIDDDPERVITFNPEDVTCARICALPKNAQKETAKRKHGLLRLSRRARIQDALPGIILEG